MSKGRVIVTGGAGYIGRCMVELLRDQGYTPVILDDLSVGHPKNLEGQDHVLVDLTIREKVQATFEKLHDCVGLFHFAARALVGESCEKPELYFRNNFLSTLNVAQSCADFGIQNIVYSSSCSIYGLPQTDFISEDHPKRPLSPYGESKWMGEQLLGQYSRFSKLRSVCLRYFNPAGSIRSGKFGEAHNPETHLIPVIINAGISGKAFPIFGRDYDTPDGTCIRDFIHILDLTEAHLLFFERLAAGALGSFNAFNLGTGKGTSVLEVVKTAEIVMQKKVPHEFVARRPGDAHRLTADPTAAEKATGWKAHRSLAEMIRDHWEFERRNATA